MTGVTAETTDVNLGDVRVSRLDNGLTVAITDSNHAPIASTVLWYRVGAADEPRASGGIAHFLEHMMFKGSSSFGPGEVDQITQAMGGANNAFTGHDSTAYYFQFAADCWWQALEIEADRMRGLTLDPLELVHERQVILEEIAMYRSDPWDALERQVQGLLYGDHSYGRPVLGTPAELLAMSDQDLRDFHRRHYGPGNAVLVVAGDVGDGALERVEEAFQGLGSTPSPGRAGGPPPPAGSLRRIGRRQGDVARMVWSVPAPAWDDALHPPLRLLVQLLFEGRSSLLQRALVEEGQLCSWVSGELSSNLQPGALSVAVEVLPGVEPRRVEEEVFRLLAEAVAELPETGELERARRTYEADWVFGHERVHQRALTIASALALFDLDFPSSYVERVLASSSEEILDAGRQTLLLDRGVLGWSLPESG